MDEKWYARADKGDHLDLSLIVAAVIAASPGLAAVVISLRNGRKTDSVGVQVSESHDEMKLSVAAVASEVTAANGQTVAELLEKWEQLRLKAEKERAAALARLAAMKEAGQ